MGALLRKPFFIDVLCIVVILLCGWKFTQHLPELVDYPISDEGAYLQDGLDIPKNGIKPACWGSLYNIWYYAGSLLISDKIALYYAHVKLITLGIPVLLFLLLRIVGCSALVSLITAFAYLLSFGNLYIFHKGNHTALFLMLLVLVLGYRWHRSIHFWLLASASVLLSAFIRPELFIAFWLTMGWYLYLLMKSSRTRTVKAAIAMACVIATVYFSNLMFAGQNRSFYTFRSNFPVNYVKWNHITLDPDQNNELLFREAFGDATTIGGAMRNNPRIFFKNIVWNVGGMCMNYAKLGLSHFNIFLPAETRRSTFIEGLLFMAALTVYIWYRNRKSISWKTFLQENARWLWFSFLLLIPCVVANVLFYPRFNYIMLPIFLSFVLVPVLFFRKTSKPVSWFTITLVSVLLFMLTPSPGLAGNWYFAATETGSNLEKTPVKNAVEAIEALPLKKKPCVSFIAEKAMYQYSDRILNTTGNYHPGMSVEELIAENDLSLVVVSRVLLTNDIVNQIPGFQNFIIHPEPYKFRRFEIKNSASYLLVREDMLN